MSAIATFLLLTILCLHLSGVKTIPWLWGSSTQETKSGRVKEFDEFLTNNVAKIMTDRAAMTGLLPRFIEYTKQVGADPECTKYYVTVMMKLSELGLDAAMNIERAELNQAIARSMTNPDAYDTFEYSLKKRHILDAYVDAASLHAWPTIKGNIRKDDL